MRVPCDELFASVRHHEVGIIIFQIQHWSSISLIFQGITQMWENPIFKLCQLECCRKFG